MTQPLLAARGITLALREKPDVFILNDVSLIVAKGKIIGVVGGSGSGKTTLASVLLGFVPDAMRLVRGQVVWDGVMDILDSDVRAVSRWRGARVGMSFQEPASAFDPVFTVGDQILETLMIHCGGGRGHLRERMLEFLALAGIDDPRRVAACYPHELSGGLRQRAMIAMAVCTRPALLVADEPTSSLDVILQARIMELFRKLRRELGLSIVLIAHDLGMVSRLADDIVILSHGRVIADDHPDARALLSAGGM
ncbi:MAG: ATP-binding cassette domain-containing protein [Candidatus Omnitrophota bacterium]